MGKVYYTSFGSKIGTIYVASSERGVCKIAIPGQSKKEFLQWLDEHTNGDLVIESATKNRQIIDELNRYFERRLVKFNSRIDLVGTLFQRRVWRELRRIRYGTTITYKELAKRIGCPEAYRAVGRANGANPLPILIPCHRVICSNEKIGGYTPGLKTKEFLLRLEGALPKERHP
ncbi:MAG: methylated-DNA--[protein]-cysteine S-methyltransferase [Bacteroidetes bacterium]|nr:methylated-DNA--[protein]-cysteine S-methyltransferase [Bacteroidota bacterium]